MPMVSAVWKLIILSDNCSYWTLVFLVEYRQNAIPLWRYFWVAISMYVGEAIISSHNIDGLSYFRFPDIVVQVIDMSSSWSFTLSINVDHTHSTRTINAWLLKPRMRVMANVSVKRSLKASISRDHQYTKSKKEVTGDVFMCSCFRNYARATATCNKQRCVATWPTFQVITRQVWHSRNYKADFYVEQWFLYRFIKVKIVHDHLRQLN